VPLFRDYTEATTLHPTDAFVLDRIGFGTMYIEADNLAAAIGEESTFPRCLTYVIDGGGSAISTGVAGDLYVPFPVNIVSATLLADQTGSVVVDIWSDAYANFPPTIADTITGSAPPTISAAAKAQDSTLTGWTTLIPAGNTLRFNVNSVSTITRLTIALATG
jgi:hypothetical protein